MPGRGSFEHLPAPGGECGLGPGSPLRFGVSAREATRASIRRLYTGYYKGSIRLIEGGRALFSLAFSHIEGVIVCVFCR